MNNNQLGNIIRQRRKVLKITQDTLADLSQVGLHSISDIESGKGNSTIGIAKKLLAPLGLKLVVQIAEPKGGVLFKGDAMNQEL